MFPVPAGAQALPIVTPFLRRAAVVDEAILHRLTEKRLGRERITGGFLVDQLRQFLCRRRTVMEDVRQPQRDRVYRQGLRS